jgi:hypothetical protein
MVSESSPRHNQESSANDVVEPNGRPKWENDVLGTSDADRMRATVPPLTSQDVAFMQEYCYEPLPNGKSAFENDMLGITEIDRITPTIL